MLRRFQSATCALVLALGCGAPDPGGGLAPRVRIDPEASADAVPAVFRVRVTGIPTGADALLLFRGDLSAHNLGRIAAGALDAAVAAKKIASLAWSTDEGDLMLAPIENLEPGTPLSLAALGHGLVTRLTVASSPVHHLVRRLFPKSPITPSRRWVFCGAPTDLAETPSVLDPLGVVGLVAPGADTLGADRERCVRVDIGEPEREGTALPPVDVSGTAFEPIPMGLGATHGPALAAPCNADEIAIGPGCAVIEDDRFILRGPPVPILWVLDVGGTLRVVSSGPAERIAVKGLTPASESSISGTAADASGQETPFDLRVVARAVKPHIVLNEVLGNPLGPEPQQEWIEIVNDGSAAVSLDGFRLGDAVTGEALPPAVLAPGELALVVSEGFEIDAGLDVRPASGTALLRVPRLSPNGLSNSGEKLVLHAPDGAVVSEFPAVPAPKAGVSVARKNPWTLDDAAEDFAPSRDPGATPGADNGTEAGAPR